MDFLGALDMKMGTIFANQFLRAENLHARTPSSRGSEIAERNRRGEMVCAHRENGQIDPKCSFELLYKE